jgi:pimeloyl-ACP methyl ester carboxylesterase
MSTLELNDARIYYEDSGGSGAPVMFAHGLLWSCRMFDAQVAALKGRFRCVAYDFRGQGQSEVTESGYDFETLTADTIGLIENLKLAPVHFVGLSMGGMVGIRLAARRPELVRSLVLLETSADPEPEENVPQYRRLNLVARWFGLSLVAGRVMPIMFGRKFLEDPARAAERSLWRARALANNRKGITRAVTGVITRRPVLDELGKIRAPTLIMVGDQDLATVPAKAERIHERIAGSRLVVIPGAGHTSTVEESAFVTGQISAFLSGQASEG